MKSDFAINGMRSPVIFTCSNIGKEDIFWIDKFKMAEDRVRAFYRWAKNDEDFRWKNNWIAEVEHDGFYSDGTPKNPVLVTIKPANQ